MKESDPGTTLERLVELVRKGEAYREIQIDLVRSIGKRELRERRTLRDAVKATRSKLHQVGGAYLPGLPDYPGWIKQLEGLPADRQSPELRSFCLEAMRSHASTRERLPVLKTFFSITLKDIAPIRSVLDLACGLNPLALPWMPIEPDAMYYACDIYGDMVSFLSLFFAHLRQNGRVWSCDLSQGMPNENVNLALLLKAIPCLEQLDKGLPLRLLEEIRADHLLVSFPLTSLGGRGKGMRVHYEAHFMDLIAGHAWRIERFEFPGELAFLVTK